MTPKEHLIACAKALCEANGGPDAVADAAGISAESLKQVPAKLHLHQLVNKTVASALPPVRKVAPWTLHVTADDRYKASFTLEDGVAYLRLCDEHDVVDKHP